MSLFESGYCAPRPCERVASSDIAESRLVPLASLPNTARKRSWRKSVALWTSGCQKSVSGGKTRPLGITPITVAGIESMRIFWPTRDGSLAQVCRAVDERLPEVCFRRKDQAPWHYSDNCGRY